MFEYLSLLTFSAILHTKVCICGTIGRTRLDSHRVISSCFRRKRSRVCGLCLAAIETIPCHRRWRLPAFNNYSIRWFELDLMSALKHFFFPNWSTYACYEEYCFESSLKISNHGSKLPKRAERNKLFSIMNEYLLVSWNDCGLKRGLE
jgi:hypothetical protein